MQFGSTSIRTGPSRIVISIAILAMLIQSIPYDPIQDTEAVQIEEDQTEPTRSDIVVPYIDRLEYIAIGPSRFSDEIEPLIEWKTQKGIKAHYFTLEGDDGVLAASNGRDIQEKVRNYIKAMWEKNPLIKWVLIVGDGEIIPPRRTFVNGTSENGADEDDNYVMSDIYYAGLTGNWDTDDDNIFGEDDEELDELDFQAEVNLGRFPASNEEELEIMVKRQLSYEKEPVDGAWTNSMLLAGSLMDAPNNKDMFDPYKDNAYELVLRIEEQLPEHVEPFHLFDYPRLEWGGYNRMFDTLNETSFIDHYEAGFSTVMLACHGDINGNCTDYKGDGGGNYPYWADYQVYFDYDSAEQVRNKMRTPLVYISNCDSLNFTEEDDTNMETLMRNPDGGAIGVIGASVTTYRGEYRDETSWGNWWLAQEFFRILYEETSRPGEALYKLKENHIYHVSQRTLTQQEERMYYIDNLAYNLLGDPEGPLWLDTPRILDVEYPDEYFQDNSSMKIKVRDTETGDPVPGATVTLIYGDEIYLVETTDVKGEAIILLNTNILGEAQLTVVKEGFIPKERSIAVVSLKNVEIMKGLILEPEIPVLGRPLTVSTTVKNTGTVTLNDVLVRMELTSDDPGFEGSSRPDKHISTLQPGEEVEVNLSFDPYKGINTIKATALLLSDSVEWSMEDNTKQMMFRVNEPLIIGSLPNLATLEDTRLSNFGDLFNISSFVLDPDNYPDRVTFRTETKGNLTAELFEGGLLDVIPKHDWNGKETIRIFASDGSVEIYTDLLMTVHAIDDPPVFKNGPGYLKGNKSQPILFQIELDDVDSNEITLYSPDTTDIEFKRVIDAPGMVYNVTFTPGENLIGYDTLTLIAEDKTGENATMKISLEIGTTNDPPEVKYPTSIKVTIGEEIKIPLEIIDPDNSGNLTVGLSGIIVKDYIFDEGVLIITMADNTQKDTYQLIVWVDDNETNGNFSFNIEVKVEEEEQDSIYITLGIILAVIVVLLGSYMILIRSQENKQKKMLGMVEDQVRLENPMKDKKRKRSSTRSKPKKNAIPAPPSPADLEANLARMEIDDVEKRMEKEEPTAYQDLESDLDDVITELYPDQ